MLYCFTIFGVTGDGLVIDVFGVFLSLSSADPRRPPLGPFARSVTRPGGNLVLTTGCSLVIRSACAVVVRSACAVVRSAVETRVRPAAPSHTAGRALSVARRSGRGRWTVRQSGSRVPAGGWQLRVRTASAGPHHLPSTSAYRYGTALHHRILDLAPVLVPVQ